MIVDWFEGLEGCSGGGFEGIVGRVGEFSLLQTISVSRNFAFRSDLGGGFRF